MFGNLGNMASLLKQAPEMMRQAQQMQERMGDMRDNLCKIRVEGQAGGGMVKVQATADQKVQSIQVEQSLLDSGDGEMLEDLLVAAVNQSLDKAKEAAAEEMGKMTGEMNIPGLNDALSKMGLGDMGADNTAT
ncbi:MAG: YbaB/EbfC family nucleoid-associated protein [Planctomycetaceae bacterium]|jgi:nucleoid-associated protein EbfC|nr:YbaB/EbfC family nucleoid-associated protein [Planctomycetaceae bacterium]MBT6157309.1 YbaB/EbfC family nucleoid-associated protein [Planctomycetaceae bacterium]MBT6487685.1 YbaB/EbfC family nucleoid-associated protein [Planctomycetaceae bacterium]MBT6495721.1 YbaB/EbfC family nucleoid-associated protein [Planctomycetaceae bacterium]